MPLNRQFTRRACFAGCILRLIPVKTDQLFVNLPSFLRPQPVMTHLRKPVVLSWSLRGRQTMSTLGLCCAGEARCSRAMSCDSERLSKPGCKTTEPTSCSWYGSVSDMEPTSNSPRRTFSFLSPVAPTLFQLKIFNWFFREENLSCSLVVNAMGRSQHPALVKQRATAHV